MDYRLVDGKLYVVKKLKQLQGSKNKCKNRRRKPDTEYNSEENKVGWIFRGAGMFWTGY